MIKINVLQLERQELDLAGTEGREFLDIEDSELIQFSGKVSYQLHASLVNRGVLVAGSVKTKIHCVCGRCLKEFDQVAENSAVCRYYEDVTEPELDITEDIREDMLVSIPVNYLCSEDCKGLCQHCGIDLNKKKCKCHEKKKGSDAWGALDDLKL
ncbi:MAG: YceD family protein [Victivallaceae bacterium]